MKHPIVQVINFLRNYDESSTPLRHLDRLILILLASRKGTGNIYPSQKTLSKECHVSIKHLRRRIQYLRSINILKVEKHHRSHHYFIQIPIESYPQIGDIESPYENTIGDIEDPLKGTSTTPIRGHPRPPKSKENSKTKREERTLSVFFDFELTSEERERCKAKGLDAELTKEKFMLYTQSVGKQYADVHAAFQLWVERERAAPNANGVVASIMQSIPTCAGCGLGVYSCRCRVSSCETASKHLKTILENIK